MNLASWIILALLAVAVFFAMRYVWKSTQGGKTCMDCQAGKNGTCGGSCTNVNVKKMQRDIEKLQKRNLKKQLKQEREKQKQTS